MKIAKIRQLIFQKQYSISKHAFIESFADNFSIKDILEGVERGEIIEEYPERNRCLIYSNLDKGPIHIVVSYSEINYIWIVTVYKPDPKEWAGNKIRKA